MAGQAKQTTNHAEIRRWAEERGGKPALVRATREKRGPSGILRIDFPGYSGDDTLEEISWEEFFRTFDQKRLAFLYQDETGEGEESRFFRLVHR